MVVNKFNDDFPRESLKLSGSSLGLSMKFDHYGTSSEHPYIRAGHVLWGKGIVRYSSIFYDLFKKNKVFSGSSKIKKYAYTKNGYNFYMEKEKNNNGNTQFFIGKQDKCLVAVISEEEKILIIRNFKYDEHCVEGARMKRINGTDKMMRVFLQFVKEHLQHKINKIILIDNSAFYCNLNDTNIAIPLSCIYFFKYGHTYYMKYGFRLSKANTHKYSKIKRLLKVYSKKNKITKELVDNYIKFCKLNYNLKNKETFDYLQRIINEMNQCKTIMEFLQKHKFEDCSVWENYLIFLCQYYQKYVKFSAIPSFFEDIQYEIKIKYL